jgi:hypothetical protein
MSNGITIYPRVADDDSPFWKLQFGNLSLHSLILQGNPFHVDNLISVGVAVNTRPQSDIAFNFAKTQTDESFVEFVLIHR